MNSKLFLISLALIAHQAIAIYPESVVDLGCWANLPNIPLFTSLENTTDILDGKPETRYDPIQKCKKAAQEVGYEYFAIQQGSCLSSPVAEHVYQLHGRSDECPENGAGSQNASQVYKMEAIGFASVSSLGCWITTSNITKFSEIKLETLRVPKQSENITDVIIQRCALATASRGIKVFTIQENKCFTSSNITELYQQDRGNLTQRYQVDGQAYNCSSEGAGGNQTQQVFIVTSLHPINLTSRGCWQVLSDEIPSPSPVNISLSEPAPLLRCVEIARQTGNTGFIGVEEEERCVKLKELDEFAFQVPSDHCISSGLGGDGAMDVYEIDFRFEGLPISGLGCWEEADNVTSLEGTSPLLSDNYRLREDALKKCARVAYMAGYDVIALVDGGKCVSGYTMRDFYRENGPSSICPQSGRGALQAMEVYELNIIDIVELNNLSCWKDSNEPVIPSIEGTTGILDGCFTERKFPVEKCQRAAADLGFQVFALQDGGMCLTSSNARRTYRKYGPSDACDPIRGAGNIQASEVYETKSIKKVSLERRGCWRDVAQHVIPTLEGLDPILLREVTATNSKVQNCAKAAASRGYTHFAVQEGKCYSSRDAKDTYKLYGKSTACPPSGLGAQLASEVYEIVVVSDMQF